MSKYRVSYPQRIALDVLAKGGVIEPGVPGKQAPTLYYADHRVFSRIQRQLLRALIARGWVGETARRYEVTHNGRAAALAHRP